MKNIRCKRQQNERGVLHASAKARAAVLLKFRSASVIVICALMASLQTACAPASGTSTGNPVVANFVITNSSQPVAALARHLYERIVGVFFPQARALPPPAMQDANGAMVTLSSVWLSVKSIELKPLEQPLPAETDDEIALAGPLHVDLLSASPEVLGQVALVDQLYRRIEMKLSREGVPPAGAPAGFQGNSIYVEGVVGGRTFTYAAVDETEFRVSGPGGFQPQQASNILVVVKFADLIKKTDLSGVTDGSLISHTNRVAATCPEIDPSALDVYTCFRKGLEALATAGLDRDGDHHLSGSDDSIDD